MAPPLITVGEFIGSLPMKQTVAVCLPETRITENNHQKWSFKNHKNDPKIFLRTESNTSDEGVVADFQPNIRTVSSSPASLGSDVPDCDFNRRKPAPSEDTSSTAATDEGTEEETDMRLALNRLNSFHNWPLPFQNPLALAEAGFFYTGHLDLVKCAFCHEELGNWRRTDVPMQEHIQHFPRCSFVRSKSSPLSSPDPSTAPCSSPLVAELASVRSNSLPLSSPDPSTAPSSPSRDAESAGEDVCGWYFPCRNPEPVLVAAPPTYPSMVLYKDRFATFASWPREKTQTARDMASAGLFYTGVGGMGGVGEDGVDDRTVCFHCGGSIYRWEVGDEPWTEHARLYPHCQYLIASKGRAFVQGVGGGEVGGLGPGEVGGPVGYALVRASLTNSSQGSSTGTPSSGLSSGFEDESSVPSSHESELFSDRSMSDEESEVEVIGEAVLRNHALMDAIQEAVAENRRRLFFAPFQTAEHLVGVAKAIQSRRELQKQMLKEEAERPTTPIPSNFETLTKEYERLRKERSCKVCLDKDSQTIFHPCGHMVCCWQCAKALRSCPVCRNVIAHTSPVYMS